MKQVYFSEKLNKYFDSKKECEVAEAAFDQEKIKKEKAKLKSMMSSSPDANITRNYIDLLTQLP